jgi:hypothetical protein
MSGPTQRNTGFAGRADGASGGMIDRPLRLFALLPLFASACASPPAAPPPHIPHLPVPANVPAPPPPPKTTDWRDIPLTPGDWRYGPEAGGSARFGLGDAAPEFVVRCDRMARTITLARTSTGMAPATMAITTSAGDRAIAAAPFAGPPAALAATLPVGDGFLDRMAFSRGRFVVAVTGSVRLVLPSWPEFARVIEDCRG